MLLSFEPLNFEQPQIRPRPVDAVPALGIAGDLAVRSLTGFHVVARAAVVQTDDVVARCILVAEHCVVATYVSFPRFCLRQGKPPCGHGFLQFEPDVTFNLLDDVIVEEQLALRADVNRFAGHGDKRSTDRTESRHQSEEEVRHFFWL